MEDKSKWTLRIKKNNVNVYTKMEEGEKILSSMAEVTIDAPICTVIAMFSESDLFK